MFDSATPWTIAGQSFFPVFIISWSLLKLMSTESVMLSNHLILCHSVDTVRGVKGTHAAAAAQSLQSCPTLCDPIEGSPPGSAIPGILQARTLEWVVITFSTWEAPNL